MLFIWLKLSPFCWNIQTNQFVNYFLWPWIIWWNTCKRIYQFITYWETTRWDTEAKHSWFCLITSVWQLKTIFIVVFTSILIFKKLFKFKKHDIVCIVQFKRHTIGLRRRVFYIICRIFFTTIHVHILQNNAWYTCIQKYIYYTVYVIRVL